MGGVHVGVWDSSQWGGGSSHLCRERDLDLRRRDLDRERECLRFSSFLTVDVSRDNGFGIRNAAGTKMTFQKSFGENYLMEKSAEPDLVLCTAKLNIKKECNTN